MGWTIPWGDFEEPKPAAEDGGEEEEAEGFDEKANEGFIREDVEAIDLAYRRGLAAGVLSRIYASALVRDAERRLLEPFESEVEEATVADGIRKC